MVPITTPILLEDGLLVGILGAATALEEDGSSNQSTTFSIVRSAFIIVIVGTVASTDGNFYIIVVVGAVASVNGNF